jgi:hypothetical protein
MLAEDGAGTSGRSQLRYAVRADPFAVLDLRNRTHAKAATIFREALRAVEQDSRRREPAQLAMGTRSARGQRLRVQG